MKLNRKSLNLQRKQLDKRIKNFLVLKKEEIPASGWIKAIREALGMPTSILAKRLKIAQPSVMDTEKYEASGSITLNALRKAADALNCDLKYVLVPKGNVDSLEEIVQEQALKAATKEIGEVNQTMALEKQAISKKDIEDEINSLAKELKEKLSSKIWEE